MPKSMERIRQDLRFGWRVLRARPTPSLLAVAALALAIGVGTAIFSIVNAVLLQPLPYRDAGRVVMVWNINEKDGFNLKQLKAQGRSLSVADYRDWVRQTDIFENFMVFGSFLTRLTRTDDPEMIFGYRCSPGAFPLLGVSPMLGRGFLPEDEKDGADPVVVLQHEFWRRRYHGNPRVLGQKMYLWNQPYTIVGVMRPEFVFFNRQVDFLATDTFRQQDAEKYRGRR